jgi:O-antigen/teichoic acid export membrane protein
MSSNTQAAAPHADAAGNAGVAMLAKALYLVTRLCVPPLVLAHITLAEYGLWTACFVLIMYVGLTDVGFSNVYVRFTARYHAEGDVGGVNRLLSTGVIMLSVMALFVLAGVWLSLPLLLDFLKIDAIYREKASVLVLGTTGMFLLDLTLGAYCYLLHGLQRIKEEQKIAIAGYLLELVLIFAFLRAGFGVYALLMAFVLRYSWSLLSFMRLAHRFLPGLQIRPRHFDKSMLRHFFGFGATVQASALLGTALFSIDRLLAGFLLGPKGIALFELAAKLPVSALAVPSAISNVTLAAASGHAARDNAGAIRDLYQQATRSVSLLAAIPLGFMAVFAEPIGRAWLGKGGELSADLSGFPMIMALTALWSHLHIVTGPGSAILRAMGKAGNEFIYHGLRFVLLAISVSVALQVMPSTTQGLAWGLSIGGAAAAAAYLVVNQRVLAIPRRRLLSDVLLPGLLAYPVAGLLRVVWDLLVPLTLGRWETLAALALFGTLYVLVFLLFIWNGVLTRPERVRLSELFVKSFGRLPQWKNS